VAPASAKRPTFSVSTYFIQSVRGEKEEEEEEEEKPAEKILRAENSPPLLLPWTRRRLIWSVSGSQTAATALYSNGDFS
jgi:hypothetical protein